MLLSKTRHSVQKKKTVTPFHLILSCSLMTGLSFTALTGSMAAQADTVAQVHTFDIQAGALDTALTKFGQQAGIMVSVSGAVSREKQTAGVNGTYSTARGLQILLQGTGLKAVRRQNGSYTVEPVNAMMTLDPLRVEARDANANAADRATAVYVADAELENARMGDLKDVFAGIASVSVGGAIPLAQKMYVNGVDMLNLAVTVDGVSHNNRVFHHVAANAFDPGLIKFVRVDPGVATADAGPNALAGGVVMETVDAADLLDAGKNIGGSFRTSYSSNGDTFGNALTLAGRSNGFEGLIYGKVMDGDDYEDGDGDTIRGTSASLESSLLKLAYQTDSGNRVEFSGQRMVDDADRRYRANFGDLSGRVRPGQTETRPYNTERNTYALSYEMMDADGWFDPKAVLGFSETIVGLPTSSNVLGSTETYSATVQNTFHLSSDHNLVAGLDFYDRESEIDTDTSDPLSEEARNAGAFVQSRLQVTDRLKLSAGARYDRQKFEGQNGFSKTVSGGSVNTTVTYELRENLSVRSGYSNVFGGINVEDNYLFGNDWTYVALHEARADNLNVGIDWQYGSLTVSGEIFRTEIDDIRNGDSNDDFDAKGYNLGATYGWTNGFSRLTVSDTEISVNGELGGSYTLLDYGTPLGTVIAFEIQQNVPDLNLLLGAGFDIALDYNDAADTEFGNQRVEGYEVVNVYAEYTPDAIAGLRLRAEANNLFDRQYADQATYGGDFEGIVTLKEPGRSLTVSAVFEF